MSRLFGTDGVRGVANTELSARLAFDLGGAAVAVLTEQGETRPRVAVGRDTRASGEFLQAALVAGICSAGGDTILLGVTTTPAVAFLTLDLGATAGAVISASHNPAEYNGIKFFGPNGYKLPDELEDRIESLLDREDEPRPSGRDVGRVLPKEGSMERYLAHFNRAGKRPTTLRASIRFRRSRASLRPSRRPSPPLPRPGRPARAADSASSLCAAPRK